MKEITNLKLKEFQQKYEKNDSMKILRKVLVKNDLTTISTVLEAQADTQFQFSIDLETLPATYQASTGRCWIFAGLNVLREKASKVYNVKNIEFSQNYTAFWDKYEKSNYFIQAMDDFLDADSDDRTMKHLLEQGIQDGGQWDMFVNLVLKYGVVPKSAMPETHSSSNTRKLNRLVNMKLRKYAATARKMYKDGLKDEISQLKEKTLYELYSLLATTLGVPPKRFDFEYVDKDKKYHIVKDLDPFMFYKKLDFDLKDYVSVVNAPTKDKPYYQNYTVSYLGNVVEGKIINHLNLPMERLEELILAQLLKGEVVWFGCDVSFDNNRKEGIWNPESFDYEHSLQMEFKMSKADRLDYLQGTMNHAMVLTGVNIYENEPTKWKIQNSWGEKAGNNGYYLMTQEWFKEHTYQIVVNKKYLTKEEIEILNKEPIKLKPWDPIGSLA